MVNTVKNWKQIVNLASTYKPPDIRLCEFVNHSHDHPEKDVIVIIDGNDLIDILFESDRELGLQLLLLDQSSETKVDGFCDYLVNGIVKYIESAGYYEDALRVTIVFKKFKVLKVGDRMLNRYQWKHKLNTTLRSLFSGRVELAKIQLGKLLRPNWMLMKHVMSRLAAMDEDHSINVFGGKKMNVVEMVNCIGTLEYYNELDNDEEYHRVVVSRNYDLIYLGGDLSVTHLYDPVYRRLASKEGLLQAATRFFGIEEFNGDPIIPSTFLAQCYMACGWIENEIQIKGRFRWKYLKSIIKSQADVLLTSQNYLEQRLARDYNNTPGGISTHFQHRFFDRLAMNMLPREYIENFLSGLVAEVSPDCDGGQSIIDAFCREVCADRNAFARPGLLMKYIKFIDLGRFPIERLQMRRFTRKSQYAVRQEIAQKRWSKPIVFDYNMYQQLDQDIILNDDLLPQDTSNELQCRKDEVDIRKAQKIQQQATRLKKKGKRKR